MPFFRVIVHGTGIIVPNEEGGEPIIGFFTTRSVRARSSDAAAAKAQEMVLRDWTTGRHATANKGGPPVVTVDSIYATTFLEHVRFKNTGHAFYAVSDANAA